MNLTNEQLDAAIAQHRMGTLTVRTKPGSSVRVQQMRHDFWFGATLNMAAFTDRLSAEARKSYFKTFAENFNAGVTDNQFKWHQMEPERGHVNYAVVDATLAWAEAHNIPVRGHCLFWGVPRYVQDWVKALDDQALRRTIEARARGVVARYRGRFTEYDLNNEMIHANYYADRLGDDITLQMARWAHEGDPNAALFVNDYDILTGRLLSDYINHIEQLLEQGVPISGIGVQGHLHGDTFDSEALQTTLDRLAVFGLPIRVTEFNMPGQRSQSATAEGYAEMTPDEQEAKAESLAAYLWQCFAHPAVTGIMLWGFWEGANWLPQSSLWHRDWTPTPAASAYQSLVHDAWWTDWSGTADADGLCRVRAFYGTHRITTEEGSSTVSLQPSAPQITMAF